MGAYKFGFAGTHYRTSFAEPAYRTVMERAAQSGQGVNDYAAEVARAAREAFDARHGVVAPVVGEIAMPVEHPVALRSVFAEAA